MIELGAFMGKVGVTKKNVLKLDVVKWSLKKCSRDESPDRTNL